MRLRQHANLPCLGLALSVFAFTAQAQVVCTRINAYHSATVTLNTVHACQKWNYDISMEVIKSDYDSRVASILFVHDLDGKKLLQRNCSLFKPIFGDNSLVCNNQQGY